MKARGCRASESGAVITLKPRARCSGAVHGRAAALGDKGGVADEIIFGFDFWPTLVGSRLLLWGLVQGLPIGVVKGPAAGASRVPLLYEPGVDVAPRIQVNDVTRASKPGSTATAPAI